MKFIKFIKHNLITCLCLFLASAVFLTGSVSFAKYTSLSGSSHAPNAGSFICTAKVDEVSALSFTNTAFWGGTTEDDKIAMNALRAIDFSVYNYNHADANKKPSEVKLGYSLCFSAPANFLTKLAFQLFDDNNTPLLPQIVVQRLFNAVAEGDDTGTYTTGDEDYNATPIEDLTFTVTKSSAGVYTATGGGATITLTPFDKQVQQSLNFRVWDTSKLVSESNPTVDEEGGELCSPLTVKYTATVPCYKVTIHLPEFKFGAGSPEAENYSIKIAPTSVLEDEHLGGAFYDEDGKLVTELYAHGTKEWIINSIHEEYTDTYYGADNVLGTADDTVETYGQNVLSPKVYTKDETSSVINTYVLPPETITTVTTSTPVTESTNYNLVEGTDTLANETFDTSDTSDVFVNTFGKDNVTYSQDDWRTRTYTATVTKDITQTKVEKYTETSETVTTKSDKDVTETIVVDAVYPDGLKLMIEQTITKVTKVNKSTSTTTTTTEITRTTTETRTIYGTRTCQFRYSYDSRTYNYRNNSSELEWNGGNTYEFQFLNAAENPEKTVTYVRGESESSESTTSPPTSETTEKIDRVIERSFRKNKIKLDEVTRVVNDETVYYKVDEDEDNKLKLIGDDGLQDLFISQSYSKNYPFSVDVLFEQITD